MIGQSHLPLPPLRLMWHEHHHSTAHIVARLSSSLVELLLRPGLGLVNLLTSSFPYTCKASSSSL